MDQFYSPDEIQFIVILTVVMVIVVAIATAVSVCMSRRSNQDLENETLTSGEYSLDTESHDIWSVQGHYNPIAT